MRLGAAWTKRGKKSPQPLSRTDFPSFFRLPPEKAYDFVGATSALTVFQPKQKELSSVKNNLAPLA